MTLRPRHPPITKTPTELRAKAREYEEQGMYELAKYCRKQADYVEHRDKKSR